MTDYGQQVRDYLAYCRRSAREMEAAGGILDARYHPTPDGCCKLIPHGGDTAKAAQIRAAFREITEGAAS
jgi:hypothetical protein